MSRIFAQLFWISFLVLSVDGLPANVMRDSSKGLTDVASIFAAITAQRAEPTMQLFDLPATTLSGGGFRWQLGQPCRHCSLGFPLIL